MRTFVIGAIFGIFATIFGLFAGLQINPMLANVLLFPALAVSLITDTPLGMMSGQLRLLTLLVMLLAWGFIFVFVKASWNRLRRGL